MSIDGMDCASCAVTLERSVQQVDGVQRAVVNFASGRLDVIHDDAATARDIEQAVHRAGFRVASQDGSAGSSYWSSARARLTLAASILYAIGLTSYLTDVPDRATIAIFAACIALAGLPIFRAAWVAIRARHMDMNVLMSAATIGAAIIGEWAEAASVVVLFAVGNALQSFAVDRTRNAVRALARLAPSEVLVIRDGDQRLVDVAQVVVGELCVVRPGERIAIDGTIVEGSSSVNEASVTGESNPIDKSAGDSVLSGTLNADGSLVVRAERAAADSTLQQIVRLVEQAQSTKAPTEQLVDRFSRIYTPIVVLASLTLIAVPILLGGDASTWVYRGLALLIIACPCSLVISTPVTVVSAIGAASRRGLLIKGGEALEATGRMRAIAFDKTGTLTEGRPVVSSVQTVDGFDRERALVLAASVERRSEHPLAHAILTAADGLELLEPSQFTSVPGRGAAAQVDGTMLYVGSPRLMRESGIPVEGIEELLRTVDEAGETPVILADAQRPLAVFGLADAIRHDARASIQALRHAGIQHIVMLTGDSRHAARRVADDLGLEYHAELLPEDKLRVIQELRDEHSIVGMVGDGVNDAPALAAASVSFAMGAAGSDVALESADVALMQDDLRHLVGAVHLSRSAERIIRQNVIVSLVIKGAFVLLAPFGLVTLWAAVLADMGTSLAVTGNGLRLFRERNRGA
jgi:Cd2+/Zn2+-exporting ATPase